MTEMEKSNAYWLQCDDVYEKYIPQEVMRQKSIYPNPAVPVVWTSILTEELGEVAAAQLRGENVNYREELVQLAAATIRAIVDFDNGLKTAELKKR